MAPLEHWTLSSSFISIDLFMFLFPVNGHNVYIGSLLFYIHFKIGKKLNSEGCLMYASLSASLIAARRNGEPDIS